MIDAQQFVLIQDDDCHWYVCPVHKQAEAFAYFATADAYWDDPESSGDPPVKPAYLDPVGGTPCRVKFTGYTIVR